jgi:hypothetical protein
MFDGLVSVEEGGLLAHRVTKVLGESFFAFRLHYPDEGLDHVLLLLLSLLSEMLGFGYLEKRLLVRRVVLCEIVVEPNFDLP